MSANMMRRIRAAFVERSKARRSRRKRSESEQLENEFARLMARSDARGLGVLLAEQAEHQSFPKRGIRARRVLGITRPSSEDPVQRGDISAVAARKQFGVLRRRDEQRLLVLERSGLRQDLQHGLLERGWDGTLLPIQRRHFKQIAQSILGLDVGDFRYLESTTSESRARLRTHFSELLGSLFGMTRSRTLVSANIAYWADQELADAAHRSNGRLLVLHKETLMAATPTGAASYIRALRHGVRPSAHRRIAVYSATTAEVFVTAGIAEPDQITVTGAGRVDAAHALGRRRSQALARRTVTFFAFSDWVGITFPGDPEAEPVTADTEAALRWTQTAYAFRQAAEILSDARPDIRVLWKEKTGSATRVSRRRESEPHQETLAFGNKTDALRLIHESAVCCAFNSTVVLEAFAARVPVISPAFGEAAQPHLKACLIDFGRSVHQAGSPLELAESAAWFVDNPVAQVAPLTEESQVVLDHLVRNPDGRAADRLQRFLVREQAR